MNFSKPTTPCQTRFTPCWCETRPNNPHCAPSVPIQSDILTIILVLAIFGYVFWIFYRKPNQLTKEENLKWKLFFVSMQDRWIFRPNDFYKEYFKKDGELKNKYKNKL